MDHLKEKKKIDWKWAIKDFLEAWAILLCALAVLLIAIGFPQAIGIPLVIGFIYVGIKEDFGK